MTRLVRWFGPWALVAIVGCAAQQHPPKQPRVAQASHPHSDRGKIVGDSVYWVACDFVANVWHNGKRVPPNQRVMEEEIHGRTIERDRVEIREGDWLVFQLVNNPLRENGVKLFMLAVLKDGRPVLASENSEFWTSVSDPSIAEDFVQSYQSAHGSSVQELQREERWEDGYQRFRRAFRFPGAKPIWGQDEPVVWIKLRVPYTSDRPKRGVIRVR